MNRTIKDAVVKRGHYDSHDQLRMHLGDFLDAYNGAHRFKTLSDLTAYGYIRKIGTSEPDPPDAGTEHLAKSQFCPTGADIGQRSQ